MKSRLITGAAGLAAAITATAMIGSGSTANAGGVPGVDDAQQRCAAISGAFFTTTNPDTGKSEFTCAIAAKRMKRSDVKAFLYDCFVLYSGPDDLNVPFKYKPWTPELPFTAADCFRAIS